MNTFDLTLDLSKQVSMEPLRLRQGDKSGTTVRATVYDHGELVSGSYTARIAMRHPGTGATYYRETGTFSNGVATFTIDEQYAATVTGRTTGYVQLLQGSTVIASTADFPVVILRDATEGAVPGEVYDSAIEDALAELDEATGRISVMVQEQVAEELAAHPEWTTTVTDNSVTDAKLVQTGGILSRVDRLMYRLDNLLTGDTGEQEVTVVADAAATPVAGLSVYGRSVQDGTPTPDAPVPIQSVEGNLLPHPYQFFNSSAARGVTYTQNADGSITAQGTATGLAYLQLCRRDDNWLNLVPGEAYMVVAHSSNVCAMNTANSSTSSNVGQVTIPTDDSNWGVGIAVASGMTINETFNVDLFHVAAPVTGHVPYGCAGLSAMGGNLLGRSQLALNKTANGITITDGGNGWIDVAGTFNGSSAAIVRFSGPLSDTGAYLSEFRRGGRMSLYVEDEGGVLDSNVRIQVASLDASNERVYTYVDGAGLVKFDAGENGLTYICLHLKPAASSRALSGRIRLTLVYGDHDLTGYVPPAASVTPVPLDGHVLRSLPDGTRDEVTVDERGHAVLTQRVGEVTIDASEWQNRNTVAIGDGWYRVVNDLLGSAESVNYSTATQGMCTAAPFVYDASLKSEHVGTQNVYVLLVAQESTSAAIAAKYDGATVLYKLATPVTHDLGYVDPVALTSPDATMQAVTGIATTFRADYERDLNTTLARLEAAIATLA